MKILLVGYGRAGKDVGGEYLEQITGLKFGGTTSLYLKKYVAQRLGRSEEDVYATRHQDRETWKRIGDEIRADNPGLLLEEALAVGPITGGIRDIKEIVHARDTGLVDLIIWVENNRVPVDPTVTFTSREADIIIQNNWTIEEYRMRLTRLARSMGIYRPFQPEKRNRFFDNGLPLLGFANTDSKVQT